MHKINYMTKNEYVRQSIEEKYNHYDFNIPIDKLPWSGEIIDVKLNDGTLEQVDRLVEFTLCALYSYYFIDRYCFTLDPQKGPIPLKLFDFQKEILKDFQENNKVIFRKSRQIGASIVSGCYALWRANFHKAQIIKIISLSLNDALEFKEKTIDINYYEMPGFLKTKATRDGYSRTKLKLVNQSQIRVLSKSKNAGRGGTPSLVIIDEAAFNEYMDDIWKSILPSLDKGGDCIVISTTNGVGNWYHLTYTRAEAGQNDFHPVYIPWWKYPGRSNPWLQDILDHKVENVQKFVKEKENEQLAYDGDPKKGPWLWKMKANSKTDKEFQQEILAEFLGSGTSVITPKTITRIQEEIEDPKWIDTLPYDIIEDMIPGLWCWKKVESEKVYMLTADTATGHGQDSSTFHVICIDDNEQVAEYKNQVPTDEFGSLIKKVARYYNGAYVVVETNHPGPAVFNEIYKSKTDPYFNVYVKRKGKDLVSWETTAKSRTLLIESYFKDIENGYTKIYSERLLEEIKVFNWSESGKPEALKGYHDDLVIAWSIYAHMKDHVFNTRPIGMSSSQTRSWDVHEEISEIQWEERDEKIQNLIGTDLETYYWLLGKTLPKEYQKYKIKQKKQDNNTSVKFERPPEWLKEKLK